MFKLMYWKYVADKFLGGVQFKTSWNLFNIWKMYRLHLNLYRLALKDDYDGLVAQRKPLVYVNTWFGIYIFDECKIKNWK